MPQNFTDKQLNTAMWLYEKRPMMHKVFGIFGVAVVLLLFLWFLVITVQYVLSVQATRQKVLRTTQSVVVSPDPALQFAPEDLVIQSVQVVPHSGAGGIDFYASVNNPNTDWTATSFTYEFVAGRIVSKARTAFALPGENSIVAFAPDAGGFSNPRLVIQNVSWQRLDPRIDQERLSLLNIELSESTFVAGDKKELVDTVTARVKNNTPFGFWQASLIALVYEGSRLAGVGELSIEQFEAGEQRQVEIGLGVLTGLSSADRVDILPRVNILDPLNLM